MSWSKTDTGIKAGHKDHLSLPTNFSATDSVKQLEVEQWKFACIAADLLMKSKCIGTTGNFTVTVSGTSTAGHPATDTVTVTVTAA